MPKTCGLGYSEAARLKVGDLAPEKEEAVLRLAKRGFDEKGPLRKALM